MASDAAAIWAATAATIAVQLLVGGFLWGKLNGELHLVKFRLLRVERALELAGVKFVATIRDDQV